TLSSAPTQVTQPRGVSRRPDVSTGDSQRTTATVGVLTSYVEPGRVSSGPRVRALACDPPEPPQMTVRPSCSPRVTESGVGASTTWTVRRSAGDSESITTS